jgi:hypothetical protein
MSSGHRRAKSNFELLLCAKMASASGCSGQQTKGLEETLLSFALSTMKTTTVAGPVEHTTELQSVSEADIISPGGNVKTVEVEVHNNEGLDTGHMNAIMSLTTTSVKKPGVC